MKNQLLLTWHTSKEHVRDSPDACIRAVKVLEEQSELLLINNHLGGQEDNLGL